MTETMSVVVVQRLPQFWKPEPPSGLCHRLGCERLATHYLVLVIRPPRKRVPPGSQDSLAARMPFDFHVCPQCRETTGEPQFLTDATWAAVTLAYRDSGLVTPLRGDARIDFELMGVDVWHGRRGDESMLPWSARERMEGRSDQ